MAVVKMWLNVLLACSIGVGLSYCSGSPLEGFPDLDSAIGVRATKLPRNANGGQGLIMHSESSAAFRNLTFTCDGRIVQWWIVGGLVENSFSTPDNGRTGVDIVASPELRIQNVNGTEDSFEPQIPTDMLDVLRTIPNNTFLYPFFDNSTEFKNGSFLKILSRPSMRPSIELYYSVGNGPLGLFMLPGDQDVSLRPFHDYPLIAIQTDPAGCASGFLDLAFLESLIASVGTLPVAPGQHRMIPGLNFTSSGLLTAVTVVASLADMQTGAPPSELQLCTQQSNVTDPQPIGGTPDSANPKRSIPIDIVNGGGSFQSTSGNEVTVLQPNVYKIVLQDPIQIEPNDFLSVYQPLEASSRLYFALNEGPCFTSLQTCLTMSSGSNTSDRDLPLVAVAVDGAEGGVNGFIDDKRLFKRALLVDTVMVLMQQQYIFPSMEFTQNGIITKWIFAAQLQQQNEEEAEEEQVLWPQLQIWREVRSDDSAAEYMKIDFSILQSPQPLLGYLNVYVFTPERPLEFQAGDVLGAFQPSANRTRMALLSITGDESNKALARQTEPSPNSINGSLNLQILPLVTAEVRVKAMPPQSITATPSQNIIRMTFSTITTTPSSTATATLTVTGAPPRETPTRATTESTDTTGTGASQAALPVAAIAGGAAAGGVVLLLLVLLLVLLMAVVIVARKRRKRKQKSVEHSSRRDEALENPVYVREGDRSGDLRLAPPEPENYEVPLQSFVIRNEDAIYQTVTAPRVQEYETPSITKKQDNVYHVLEKPPSSEYHVLEQQPTNQYHTLEGPLTTPNAEEYEVFVPTGEERKAIAGNIRGRDIYASLKKSQSSSLRSDTSYFVESEVYWKPASNANQIYQQLATRKYREIPRHQIQISGHLGSGQFGTVNKGVWLSGSRDKDVAIKMLKTDATETQKVKFLQEAAIMGQFKHPNIVKLLGVVTLGEPSMIVLELLSNGDLRHYLRKQKTVPGEMPPPDWPARFLGYCQHIVAGMDYLSKKRFVHRDLAARNILVAANTVCKIADFGMSRDLEDESYYISQGGVIPVKWTAPEAINYKKYSTASDVWSFGAVMYEIWSVGCRPFKGHDSQKTLELVESGFRLPPPSGCPKEVYKLMIKCWHPQASSRPSFEQLRLSLSQPDSALLSWSEEDIAVHPQAAVLGAPLDAGKLLYKELQGTYQAQE